MCLEKGNKGEDNRLSKSHFPDFLKHHSLSFVGRRKNTGFEAPQNWFLIGTGLLVTSYMTLWKLLKPPKPWFIYKIALIISFFLGLP